MDEFTCMQLSPSGDEEPSQVAHDSRSSDTLEQVKRAFDDLVRKVEMEGEAAERTEVVQLFNSLVD